MTLGEHILPADEAVNKSEVVVPYVVALILLLYGIFIYFQAATASIGEEFQPGITQVQLLARPGLILFVVVLMGWVSKNPTIRTLAKHVTGGAIVLCILLFLYIYGIGDSSKTIDVPRTLDNTIYKAMLYPNFSNRSYAALIYGGCWAVIMFTLANLDYRSSDRR